MRRTVLLLASTFLTLLLTCGAAQAQAVDTTPPDTMLSTWDRPSSYENETNARFGFSSNESGVAFECRLDDLAFETCSSSKYYYTLRAGQHTFQVRAKDVAGNVDQTPAEYTWEIDLTNPLLTWTERPGRDVGDDEWVTNDTTPTWAWTVSDKNLMEGDSTCNLYDTTTPDWEVVVSSQPCASPFALPFELADSEYRLAVWHDDKAYNEGYKSQYFEVDTAAPKVVSATPTGRRVSRSADVKVIFDDTVYGSKPFVNIYRKGSNTPLAVYRYNEYDPDTYEDVGVELDPKNSLRAGTTYTVKVTTGVNDGANNLQAPYSWSFKTKG